MSYVFQRVNGTTESRHPPGDDWPRRHALMVMCTSTGNPRERFVQRPRQTSMYDCFGPWRGHDSAPQMGPFTGLADAQKKNKKQQQRATKRCWICASVTLYIQCLFACPTHCPCRVPSDGPCPWRSPYSESSVGPAAPMSDDSASDTASDTTTSSRDSESGSPDPGHDTPPISVNASRRGTGYSVSAYPRAGRALSGALRASFAATTNDLSALPGAPKDATSKSLQFAVPGAPGSAGGRPETGSSSPERLALSPTDTAFITSINLEDKKDDKEFNNERMLAPPVLQFPGLDPASNRVPMVFPGNIPVKAAITHTLKLQGKWMSGKITNVVVRTLQNPLTQRILTAAFWHVVLTHFQVPPCVSRGLGGGNGQWAERGGAGGRGGGGGAGRGGAGRAVEG